MDNTATSRRSVSLCEGSGSSVVHDFIMNMQQRDSHFGPNSWDEDSEDPGISVDDPLEQSPRMLDYIDKCAGKNSLCVICDFEISDIDTENHLLEECHENALLRYGCLSIIPMEGEYRYCKNCDVEFHVDQIYTHVKGAQHLRLVEAGGIFGSHREDKKINSGKIATPKNRAAGSKNIVSTEILPSCIFMRKQSEKKYFCQICSNDEPDCLFVVGLFVWYKGLEHHIAGKSHRAALAKYGCDNIVAAGRKKFFCERCQVKIPSKKLGVHVKSEKHSKIVDEEKSSGSRSSRSTEKKPIVESDRSIRFCRYITMESRSRYNCRICADVGVRVPRADLNAHITGNRHQNSLKKYGCANIVFGENDVCRCILCEVEFSDCGELFVHVRERRHLSALEKVNRENSPNEVDLDESSTADRSHLPDPRENYYTGRKYRDKSKKTPLRSANEERSVADGGEVFALETANRGNSPTDVDLDELSTADRNRLPDPRETYDTGKKSRNKSKKNPLPSTNEEKSVADRGELFALETANWERSPDDVDLDELSTADRNHLPDLREIHDTGKRSRNKRKNVSLNSANKEKFEAKLHHQNAAPIIFDSVAKFQSHIFVETVADDKHLCHLCDGKYCVGGKNLRNHIKGRSHRAASLKYGCDNIVPKENNKYYCECCNRKFSSRKIACEHVKSNLHLSRLIDKKEKSKNEDSDTDEREAGKTKSAAPGSKSCIYVVALGTRIFHCQICDSPRGIITRKTLVDHITSRGHKDSMKKYGCDSIVVDEKDNNYRCDRCDLEIGTIDKVFLHIKTDRHLSLPKVPYNLNMISNFILQDENNGESQFEEKTVSPKIDVENPEHSARLDRDPPARDLSLHYISSDPEILCKGKVSKSMSAFVHKIVKKHIDDPYCLICDFEIPGYPAVDDHILGKCHAESVMRFGCDKIVRKAAEKFHCGWCNSSISGIETVYRHIRTKGHSASIRRGRLEESTMTSANFSSLAGIEKIAQGNISQKSENSSEISPQNSSDLHNNVHNEETGVQESAEFNTIVSSLSADLSRMLAHLEVNETRKVGNSRTKETKDEKNKKMEEKKRRKEGVLRSKRINPERANNVRHCTICGITLDREADLHSHMSSHFSEEFGGNAETCHEFANNDNNTVKNSMKKSQPKVKSTNFSDRKEKSALNGTMYSNFSFR